VGCQCYLCSLLATPVARSLYLGPPSHFFDPNNAPACYCRSVSRSESQEAGAPCLLAHPEVAPPFCSLDELILATLILPLS